jgi:hypothetical protein
VKKVGRGRVRQGRGMESAHHGTWWVQSVLQTYLLAAVGFLLLCGEGREEGSEVSQCVAECTMVGTLSTTD